MSKKFIPSMPYAHIPIQEDSFIFPITGLRVAINTSVLVGKVEFVDKEYLFKNIIDEELINDSLFITNFDKVKTFAIVNLNEYGEHNGLCKAGNNSLALQILKQTIGAIYLSIYKKRTDPTFERRIVISNKGIHEVDEGLNSYLAIYDGKYMVCPNDVDEQLIGSCIDFEVENIENFINILNKNYKEKTQYEQKICKALELIYSIYNESYSRERVIKWAILLNYLFREDDEQKFDSTDIGKKLKIIFNVIEKKKILEEIPRYIVKETKKTKKISETIINIYSRVRNDLMHGKIDFYTEYAVCNLEDIIILKVVVIELLEIMASDEYLTQCKTIKDFDAFIEKKNQEDIQKYKSLKKS